MVLFAFAYVLRGLKCSRFISDGNVTKLFLLLFPLNIMYLINLDSCVSNKAEI